MHLLYCDETNLQERNGDFLIYGGLMIDGATAGAFSNAIDELRGRLGVPREYRLKFNPGPDGFDHAQFIDLKEGVLRLAADYGARLLVYLILHDIATNPDEARRNGINTVCWHFDHVLETPGLVLIDRFNDAGNAVDAHLREKFSVGLVGLPYAAEVRLRNIVGFHYSAIGQSHFPSVVDVVLGSLRFVINAHTRDGVEDPPALLGLIAPLFWRHDPRGPVPEVGFSFSPKVVRADRYRAQYEALKVYLARGGVETLQRIRAMPDPFWAFPVGPNI